MTDPRHSTDSPDATPTPDLDAYIDGFGTTFLEAAASAEAAEATERRPGAQVSSPARTRRDRLERRPHPTRRRRLALVGAGTLAVVVATVVALPILPSPTPKPLDVVAEARAALGEQGEIVHYRIRLDSTFQGFSSTDPSACDAPVAEVWQATTDGPRWRIAQPAMPRRCGVSTRTDGTSITGRQERSRSLTEQREYSPDERRLEVLTGLPSTGPETDNFLPAIDVPDRYEGNDLVTTLRAMLRDGYLREVGRSTRRGRAVIELDGLTRKTNGKGSGRLVVESKLHYVVDARTFAPVVLKTSDRTYFFKGNGRPKDGSFGSSRTTTFLEYERLPSNEENDKLLTVRPTTPVETITKTPAQVEAEHQEFLKLQKAQPTVP